MKKQNVILPCSLGCMLYGIWLSFCEIFDCRVNPGAYFLPAFVIAGALVCLLMTWRWRVTFGILEAGALMMFLYSMKNFKLLSREWESILYYVDLRSRKYYGEKFFYAAGNPVQMDRTYLWILLGIAFGVMITLFAFRLQNFQYGFVPCYLIIAAGLLLGKTPGIRGTLYMLVGIVLAMFWRSGITCGGRMNFSLLRMERQGNSWLRYPFFLLAFAMVLLAAAKLAGERQEELFAHNRNVQDFQEGMERKVLQTATEVSRYLRVALSIDSNGKLNNHEPRYAKRPVLEITVSQRPRSDVYLKGFVGSRYHRGEWKPEDVQKFQKIFPDNDSRSEVASLGLSAMQQWIEELWEDIEFEGSMDGQAEAQSIPREQQMRIEHVGTGRWSSYTYIPYFADVGLISNTDSDSLLWEENTDFIKRDTSRLKVCSSYDVLIKALTHYESRKFYQRWWNNPIYGEEGIDYASMAGSPLRGNQKELRKYLARYGEWTDNTLPKYLEYAWKEYGFRKESDFFARREFIDKLCAYNQEYRQRNMTRNMSTMDRVEFVQKLLREEASYSKELESVPAGQDYAEYFLLQQKRGFCEHFATAGTLLMRELGIPSRYVGGYKISMKSFEKNEDGTYSARVLDSDAHAWTEVLAGPMGWFPVEMTPASSSGRTKKKSTSHARKPAAVPSTEQQNRETPSPVVSRTPAVAPSATPASTGNKGRKAGEGHSAGAGMPGMAAVAGFFIAVAAAAGLWVLGWRLYYAARRKRLLHMRGRSRSLYVAVALYDLLSYMKGCGVAVSGRMQERQWLPVIEKLCTEQSTAGGLLSSEEREAFLVIVQKAAFSGKEVTQEEYDAFRVLCGRLAAAAGKRAGRLRRVYLKLTGRYGKI